MTKLEQAIEALRALPPDEQELIAEELLFRLSSPSAMTPEQRTIVEERLRQGLAEAERGEGIPIDEFRAKAEARIAKD
ncbi:hypothetical protein JANAI62_03290 [Jannaschia pagri]|uniref:Addiction module component, TIGR02574 family n=1 Tax=Jannaschia pagri TaxID=2829797 RepID=A0ABQ4NHF0_9RHOB|nr:MULTISPECIES: hypothetical protein [unclassified Jannaschia]GIT90188.1 hypothetical protein JANAI61_06460 [Jannaschia sp. AI_61]GIT93706.1 hypothetical protein JANAI62_03290 [Jannaschia sp. AI_62]